MKLIKCHIENFGKLSDFTYDLQMAATPSVRKTAGEKHTGSILTRYAVRIPE